ncbi:MAG: hypothetical protein CMK59_05265 [Proteobacteria bacterium]|nr:hypothetical protein [Pseudomonadota bacterium]
MKLIVLDFDGTMTDAEREGVPYRTGYLEDIALLADLPVKTVLSWADEFEQKVSEESGHFGWTFNGDIVAPAGVDPYLRIMPVSRMILDRAKLSLDETVRDRILDRILYKYNYMKTTTVFRPFARRFLLELKKRSSVEAFVVTNSHTTPVQNKIQSLSKDEDLDWLVRRVYGNARKYLLDTSWNDLEQPELQLPGLNRPVHTRRKLYFDLLDELRSTYNTAWSDVIVIGDIFELDLSLPYVLGANVGLICSEHTPEYEKEFLDNSEKAKTFSSLEDALTWVDTLIVES